MFHLYFSSLIFHLIIIATEEKYMQIKNKKLIMFFLTVNLIAFAAGCKGAQHSEENEEVKIKNNELNIENVSPRISGGDLRNLATEDTNNGLIEIGSFSTEILDDHKNRVKNLRIAAESLNNKEVLPGEEFSFNDTIGKRTEGKGYKKAPIIKRTKDGPKKDYGVGGGVCQLSSTLYNAAEKAGFKITEIHHHSKKVGYVPEGRDATVVYGSKDFKFINNRLNPIVIKASVSEGKVAVSIFEMLK
ncbi:MAG: VanW family protein [Clostridium sp.]|jgi:vancomycin resistance protein YoaR|nr:VanW family protein [Clostridium sp.]